MRTNSSSSSAIYSQPLAAFREQILSNLRRSQSAHTQTDYADHLYILDKSNQLTRFEPNRAQQHFLDHRTGRDLILKARQLGLSTVVQADHFLAALSRTAMLATLAHDE